MVARLSFVACTILELCKDIRKRGVNHCAIETCLLLPLFCLLTLAHHPHLQDGVRTWWVAQGHAAHTIAATATAAASIAISAAAEELTHIFLSVHRMLYGYIVCTWHFLR